MKDSDFFSWVRDNQESKQLSQMQVDGAKNVLRVVKADALQSFVAALTGWKVDGSSVDDKADTLDRVMSQKGIEHLKLSEGLRLKAYQDTGKVWTIGYGHTSAAGGLKVYQGLAITHGQAEQLLKDDLERMTYPVIKRLVKVDLTQGQFDALCSFIYNLGEGQVSTSTLLKLLNKGDYKGASNQFGRWIYDNGKKFGGLVTRREDEKELFNS
ncbi:lysozyme [Psychrobacter sp. DAB_AL43B]|uniref:lysozyme n=1 Tax=Psychrobacter sp. DAB_AL43B TaxID=1028416 RepID=UPI0009C29989|nr:lysozyme [Psychrobacter sp. DAB_AL43B]SLJ84516.1 bacteriophage lysozyme [Psychrobacter sp. DAB_AL43B]